MNRLAKLLTDVLAPWVVIIAICLAVAWHATTSVGGTLLWGAMVAVFTSVIPMGIIHLRKRRGQLTDIHVRKRTDRIVPLIAITASAAIGLAIMYVFDADDEVIALAWALFVGVLTTGLITTAWKISFHTGVAALAVVTMANLYSPWWLVGFVAIAVIAWSRVRIKDHTIAQVTAGAAWGAAITWVVYLLAL